eukprot:183020-Pelagomonas_calceolata.AAC.1
MARKQYSKVPMEWRSAEPSSSASLGGMQGCMINRIEDMHLGQCVHGLFPRGLWGYVQFCLSMKSERWPETEHT